MSQLCSNTGSNPDLTVMVSENDAGLASKDLFRPVQTPTITVKTAANGGGVDAGSPPGSTASSAIAAYNPPLPPGVPAALPAVGEGRAARPRTYYIDWLRLALTVIVVLHHCVTAYLTAPYAGKVKNDTALWLLTQLFVNGNQAYFMTLFFFLSGIYVPASYKRKGPGQFLWDRTLRLVVPCLVYSLLFAPFLIWWRDLVLNPSATLGDAFKGWYKPGWPTTYVLPTGPPWFIWMLWCFNVAYVILAIVADTVQVVLVRRKQKMSDDRASSSSSATGAILPKTQYNAVTYYRTGQWLQWGFIVTMALFVVCYATRMLNAFAFNVRPGTFIKYGPFVAFMPDYFVVYVIAFGLGLFAGPSKWNVLQRLPASMGWWWLGFAGIYWVQLGWLPNIVLHSAMSLKYGSRAFAASWLLRSFVEQSFCVIWSGGLLVVFRECFNTKPGRVGSHVVNAAYGAYIVHPIFIALFSRAIAPYIFVSSVCSAVAISCPVVFATWATAIAARAFPWADKVL